MRCKCVAGEQRCSCYNCDFTRLTFGGNNLRGNQHTEGESAVLPGCCRIECRLQTASHHTLPHSQTHTHTQTTHRIKPHFTHIHHSTLTHSVILPAPALRDIVSLHNFRPPSLYSFSSAQLHPILSAHQIELAAP